MSRRGLTIASWRASRHVSSIPPLAIPRRRRLPARWWRAEMAAASRAMAAWISAEPMVLEIPTGLGCDGRDGEWEGFFGRRDRNRQGKFPRIARITPCPLGWFQAVAASVSEWWSNHSLTLAAATLSCSAPIRAIRGQVWSFAQKRLAVPTVLVRLEQRAPVLDRT